MTWSLVPSHAAPAGQVVQLVRVVAVPPDVNELAPHFWQLTAWFSLHMLSAPHSAQPPPLAGRYLPARHGAQCVAPSLDEVLPFGQSPQLDAPGFRENAPAGHGRRRLEPSHAEPAGQSEQVARVLFVPPDVKEPAGHVVQSACDWAFVVSR